MLLTRIMSVGLSNLILTLSLLSIIIISYHLSYYADQSSVNFVGFYGSIASIWGIVFTFLQVIDTKLIAIGARDASAAAQRASESTARDLRNRYYRDLLYGARRLVSDSQTHINSNNWTFAAFRVDDLADLASKLAYARPQVDNEWTELRTSLHTYALIFREGNALIPPDFDKTLWVDLCIFISDKIDREIDPFNLTEDN